MANKKCVERYTKEEILNARQAMLESLADVSDGNLIRGCCTQDCCDDEAQALFTGILKPEPYTKTDLIRAKRAMLDELASMSGGGLVAGCCTQGCCDPEAQEWLVMLT